MSMTRVGTTTRAELPPEIWLHIAKHLPSDSLQRLSTLNHALYEAAMDDRYRRMHLDAYNADTIRNMVLIRYPHIARRVRFFEISPYAVEDLDRHRSILPSPSPLETPRSFEERLFRRLRPIWSVDKIPDQMHPERESTESMTQFVMESIKGFVNVEEYAITWGGNNAYPFDISLVNAGWRVFGKNLRWISISYPLDRFSAIFPPPIDLQNLHTLEMDCFMISPVSPLKINSEETASLLEVLASSLCSITTVRYIQLIGHMWVRFDLSPFFRALQVFPCLQAFCIDVPFERECLADPPALSDLINRHRLTLQHLALHPSHSRSHLIMQDEVFCQTVSRLLSIKLLSLELYIGLLSVDSVLRCIEPFSRTLTSLVLLGQDLVYNQIQTILATFLHRAPHDRLTVLSIGVSEVTPEVLDLLADLPSLKKLCIIAAVIDEENSKFYHTTRVYREWKDLTSLWIGRIDSRLAAWWLMMYLADYCIPTIQEFDGHPLWIDRCECAIIKIDSLRDVLTESDGLELDCGPDIDDAIGRRFQIVPYACDGHIYYPPMK